MTSHVRRMSLCWPSRAVVGYPLVGLDRIVRLWCEVFKQTDMKMLFQLPREVYVIAWLIVAVHVCFTGGLQCLQCLDAKDNGPCQAGYMKLVNASLGLGHEYLVKNCTYKPEENITQEYCMIETYYSNGEVKSFMRDCSDGKIFSFTDEAKFPRLQQVVGNNFTSCSYRLTANFHVCLSLCDTDFCNAPRPPSNETQQGCGNDTSDGVNCSASSLISYHLLGQVTGVPLLGHVFLLPLLAFTLSLLVAV